MKTLNYGGINYHVSDAMAWRVLFFHELVARAGVRHQITVPAHTDDALDVEAEIDVSDEIPIPTPVEYTVDRIEPSIGELGPLLVDETISGYLNYLNVEIEGHYDLSRYKPGLPKIFREMEDRYIDLLKRERD